LLDVVQQALLLGFDISEDAKYSCGCKRLGKVIFFRLGAVSNIYSVLIQSERMFVHACTSDDGSRGVCCVVIAVCVFVVDS